MLEVLSAMEIKQLKGVQKFSWEFSNFASIIQVGFIEKVRFHWVHKNYDKASNTNIGEKNIQAEGTVWHVWNRARKEYIWERQSEGALGKKEIK